jgi:hypothetical protein
LMASYTGMLRCSLIKIETGADCSGRLPRVISIAECEMDFRAG